MESYKNQLQRETTTKIESVLIKGFHGGYSIEVF